MAAHAAQLVEAVLPRVSVRQWVLTLPYRLRYRLAWDHPSIFPLTQRLLRIRLPVRPSRSNDLGSHRPTVRGGTDASGSDP